MEDYESDYDLPWKSYLKTITSVKISDKIIALGAYSLSNLSKVTDIKLPDSLKKIGENCFEYSGVTSLNLPAGATQLCEGALCGCNKMTSVSLPEGLTEIPDSLFNGCGQLETIHLPEHIKSIGAFAFNYNSSLTTINIPYGVTSIGKKAFFENNNLTALDILNSVTSIGEEAFSGCKAMTDIHLPEGLTEIPNRMLYACHGLTELKLPSSVTSIGEYAISGCSSLVKVELPSSLMTIADDGFYQNKSLISVVLPDRLTSIGKACFMNCSSLESVTVSNDIELSGINNLFMNCTNLKTIYGLANSPAQSFAQSNGYDFIALSSLSDAKVTLSHQQYTYDGQKKEPSVTVTLGSDTLVEGTDYTISYSDNIEPGQAAITITGLNNYLGSLTAHFTITKAVPSLKLKVTGTVTKAINDKAFNIGASTTSDATIAYSSSKTSIATVSKAGKVTPKGYGTTTITVTVPESAHYLGAKATMKVKVVPKKATLSKVTSPKKKTAKVTWKKDGTVTGYELQYAKNSSFKSAKKKTYKTKTTSATIGSLTSKKRYYFRIRSYKTVSGTKYYGAYSSVKSVKIK